MAYNKKYVSLGRVIESAYRDSGLDMIDWEAAVEWTAALIRLIGVPSSYVQKSTNDQDNNPPFIEISNYRGILPTDIVVRGECRRVELNTDGVPYKMASMTETDDIFFQTDSAQNSEYPVFFDPYFQTVSISDTGDSERVTLEQSPNYYGFSDTYSYKIEGNIIFTNFKEGYVEMAYKGFMTDEYGLPMIPDDEKYIRAVKWEIISNIDRIVWRKNPSPQNKSIYNESSQERDWAVSAAITKGRIPSTDELEAIKRSWLRSIPKTDEHSTNFKTLNISERRFTQNKRLW